MNCYFHPEKQAVSQCEQCGHGICKNCSDLFGNVCYECTEKSARANLSEAVAFKEKAVNARKGMVTGSIIGCVIGLIVGIGMTINYISKTRGTSQDAGETIAIIILMPIIMLVLGTGLGGSLVTIVKATYRVVVKACSSIPHAGFIMVLVTLAALPVILGAFFIIAPVVTLVRFFLQKRPISKGNVMVEECERALATVQSTMKSA